MLRIRSIYRLGLIVVWGLAGAAPPLTAAAAPKLEVLGDADVGLYREIFRLQDDGDFAAADKLVAGLKNRLLVGHVLLQRYLHPTAYKSQFGELRDWLERFNDLPEAYRAFSLAMARQPKGAAQPKLPVHGQEHILQLVGEPPERPARYEGEADRLADDVQKRVWKGDNTGAEDLLFSARSRKLLSAVQHDALAAQIAMGYFVDGQDAPAYRIAAEAAKRAGPAVAQADWTAGLAAWRMGRLDAAGRHFERNAEAEGVRTWRSASGAFWAGRVRLAKQDPKGAEKWFAMAARHTHHVYGQLALRMLRAESPLDWAAPEATQATIQRFMPLQPGRRALALLQIGEVWRADQEMQPLIDAAEEPMLLDLLAVALAYDAPRTAVHAAHRLRKDFETFYPAGLYPIAPWPAPAVHRIDRALLQAFMRQESQFNPRIVSPAGARGLMQLMPSTANYVVGEQRFVRAHRDGLFDPVDNVAIGARYMRYLLDKKVVDDGIFELAISYNGGIGNMIRWKKEVRHGGDPLLFMEAIPSRETRRFVSRTIANLWIYRERLGQPAPSRDDMAEGRWPRYRILD